MVYADVLNRTIDSKNKDYRSGLNFFKNMENRVYASKKQNNYVYSFTLKSSAYNSTPPNSTYLLQINQTL